MYEVSEPPVLHLVVHGHVLLSQVGGHVQRALPHKRLRVRRHVSQVVHDHEHLDDGAQRVEQGDLDGALGRHAVPLLAQVDVAQVGGGDAAVGVAQAVEEHRHRQGLLLRMEAA